MFALFCAPRLSTWPKERSNGFRAIRDVMLSTVRALFADVVHVATVLLHLSGLGGDNDVSRVKRGRWNKNV